MGAQEKKTEKTGKLVEKGEVWKREGHLFVWNKAKSRKKSVESLGYP